jgi:ABC-2 type transport system permease protein
VSAIAHSTGAGAASPLSRGARIGSVAQIERRKMTAQVPLRLLALVCALGPFAFAIVLKVQSGSPADALFGVWVHSSGYALSLVVLSFAANWGFPILAGVLAGDLFSAEDRYGTWKTLLTRSRSLSDVFAGKVLAAMTFALALGILVAVSSLLAGVILVGGHGLLDFGGRQLSASRVAVLVALSWLMCLLPLLAYTSLAVLFSVISRNGVVGVLGPVLVALCTQLLALVGQGVWVHLLLVGSAFDAWHGLFAVHPFFGPTLVSAVVCLIWIGGSLGAAWLVLRRRELASAADSRRAGWLNAARVVAALVALVAFLALASNWGPAGVTATRLKASFAPEFHRLTILQQNLLGHPIPATARYRIVPACSRRNAKPSGPGDWTCTMNVYILLQQGTQPLTDTPIGYDVSVQSNGCYKAQSAPGAVGPATIRDRSGRSVTNPLVIVYGCFNVL